MITSHVYFVRIKWICPCSSSEKKHFRIGRRRMRCSFIVMLPMVSIRYTRTDAMPLIDEHQDFCVLQTNTTGQRIYVAFERLTTTDDIDDLSFLTRVNVMFLMGTYTRSNDTSPYDPQPPFFRKSLPSATHLIYCNASKAVISVHPT